MSFYVTSTGTEVIFGKNRVNDVTNKESWLEIKFSGWNVHLWSKCAINNVGNKFNDLGNKFKSDFLIMSGEVHPKTVKGMNSWNFLVILKEVTFCSKPYTFGCTLSAHFAYSSELHVEIDKMFNCLCSQKFTKIIEFYY